ncbi:spike protein [Hainan hebius popei torovirus]|uniref:Spike protein n=1 Tax=Hainan hebius popei torovirus TaxID=2116385 RepID=A0A2P1GMY0_9NIDO|nr:spike protein [Hainan hebius popei torovirus]AVM87341.1 spike protein [Hainan hebius popei torovirus]
MFRLLILFCSFVFGFTEVYDLWDKVVCPPNVNVIDKLTNLDKLESWSQGEGVVSSKVFGLKELFFYKVVSRVYSGLASKRYVVGNNISYDGILVNDLKVVDYSGVSVKKSIYHLGCNTPYYNVKCFLSDIINLTRCVLPKHYSGVGNVAMFGGKCYYYSLVNFYYYFQCNFNKNVFSCKRKASVTNSIYYNTTYSLEYDYNLDRLKFKVGRYIYFPDVLRFGRSYRVVTKEMQFKTNTNHFGKVYQFDDVSFVDQYYLQPSINKYYNFIFDCDCSLCAVLLFGDIVTIVRDGIVVFDLSRVDDLSLYFVRPFVKPDDVSNDDYGFVYNSDLSMFSDKYFRFLSFSKKLLVLTRGYLGLYTKPYVYCVVPVTPIEKCVVGENKYVFSTDIGKFGYDNGDYFDDPIFVSSTQTLRPTLGSVKLGNTYLWNGSFVGVNYSLPTNYEVGDVNLVCNVSSFVPDVYKYVLFKLKPVEYVSCRMLCSGRGSGENFGCTEQEIKSPLMVQCREVVRQIRLLTGSKFINGEELVFVGNSSVGKIFNFNFSFIDVVIPQLKVGLNNTMLDVSNRFQELEKLFKYKDSDAGYEDNEYSLVDREKAAKDLGLFSSLMFNADRDMSTIAAFPWLAGWRFGRQINVLSYTSRLLVKTLVDMGKDINNNFEYVRQGFNLFNNQLVINSNYINEILVLLDKFSVVNYKNFEALGYYISSVEYMAARLFEFQRLLNAVSLYKARFELEFKNLALRKQLCDKGRVGCMDFNGVYINHAYVENDDVVMLLINYLKPKACDYVDIKTYVCINGETQVAPFGCVFEGVHLVNRVDFGWANCSLPLKFRGCDYEADKLFEYHMLYRPFLDSKPSDVVLDKLTVDYKLVDVDVFQGQVKDIIGSIRNVTTIEDVVESSLYGGWLDKVNEITGLGWRWYHYIYVIVGVLLFLLLMPAIVMIFNLVFQCIKMTKVH